MKTTAPGAGSSVAARDRHPAIWLAGLFVAMLAIGTDEFVIAGVLPQISADLAVPVAATGQLITAFAVTFALAAPLLALLTDRFPRRTVIVAALAAFAVANAAAALAPGYWSLLLAGDSYQLLSLILLLVGASGVGAVFLGGRITDAWGPRPALLVVIGGHAVALLGLAVLTFSGTRSVIAFAALVAVWSVFAWALNPPMQASMLAAAPGAEGTALALIISGLYLGTGVAAALGGLIIATTSLSYLPLAAAALLLAGLSLAAAGGGQVRGRVDQADHPDGRSRGR